MGQKCVTFIIFYFSTFVDKMRNKKERKRDY